MNKRILKTFSLLFSILFIMALAGCSAFDDTELSDVGVIDFYNNNSVQFEKAAKEYISTSEGKRINIFFLAEDAVGINGVEGMEVRDSLIAIWEAEVKTSHLDEMENYKNCVDVLFLMRDYMLEQGYKDLIKDYQVSLTRRDLEKEYSVDGSTIPEVLDFTLADYKNDEEYRLFYSETELLYLERIAENWYLDYWAYVG